MKLVAALISLYSVVSNVFAVPTTMSEPQASSLDAGWSNCGANLVQLTSIAIKPARPRLTDIIVISQIQGKALKSFTGKTGHAEIQIIVSGRTYPNWFNTTSVCNTGSSSGSCVTVTTSSGAMVPLASAPFSLSQILASQPLLPLKPGPLSGSGIIFTFRLMNDYDGQLLGCVQYQTTIA
jgi:hypothetical protein